MSFVRLFISVETDGPVRRAVAAASAAIRAELARGRWVGDEAMHFTLLFIGETEEGRVPEVDEAIRQSIKGMERSVIRVRGLGGFPEPGRALVLWAGVGEGEAGLCAMADRLRTGVGRFAEKGGGTAFVPHLTMARFRKPEALDRVEAFARWRDNDFGMSGVGRIRLMRSTLGPGGAVHAGIREYPLA